MDWTARHALYIVMWGQQCQKVVEGEPCKAPMQDDDRYMIWYCGITQRFTTDPGYRDPNRFIPSTPLVHEMVVYLACIDLTMTFA